ncbi:LysR family transcriptional regulator [Butyricicoccus faecihominis]|uniref:LysR family transcriptional regulator n=1 Tax=Butyricicoccus faecihominis TaxID=1712515 RepID=UPI0024797997|nr:LysR family transcriptional regulator [Butyricicoccus faecihominis]MCQ5130220.1 LysR family transcriptional regulator [Butyricicoccus faecihominis]
MDLKYLHTFRTIVSEGGFCKAAEKLNYTQSTITFQIGRLEQELSANLFEKIGRKMVLTKAGEHLVPYVDEILQSVDKLRFFEDDIAQCQGDIRIGIAETMLCYQFPAILKEFHRRAPKARLFLRSMNCYDIRNELFAGTLDIGVFYEDVGGFGSGLTTQTLGGYPLILVASPEVKRGFPDFVTPDRVVPVPFIINEPNCIFRQLFEQYLREKSIILDHTIELWSIPTIKNLVKNDVGVSFLPAFTVREELESGALVEIPTDLSGATITAVCAHHKNKWISPLMRLFLDLCSEKLPIKKAAVI